MSNRALSYCKKTLWILTENGNYYNPTQMNRCLQKLLFIIYL